jgi:hypothetical protein
MGRHPFRNSGSQPKAEHAIRCPHLSRLRREATETMLAGDWFDIVDFAEALSAQENVAGNPANISVSHRQGRLTGLASPDPVGSVF